MEAAIYLRVSSTLQEDNHSLGTQEAGCRSYCTEHGYQLASEHVYTDVHSGAELWERPGLTALREAVRAGEVHVVVAYAIDRLSRNQHHLGLLLSEAERYGVVVEFVTERLDDTPQGRFLRAALGFVADVERDKFRERSHRGKAARIQAGKPLHGQRPLYGYQWNEGKSAYLVCEDEAAIVRRIFAEVAAGKTLRRAALELTAEGVPTPLKSRRDIPEHWQTSTVQRICKQPAYWGEAKAMRYRMVRTKVRDPYTGEMRTKKVLTMRPPEEQVDVSAAIPALVDAELAAAVGERIRFNREAAARRNVFPENTLLRGGFVKCGYCGGNFVVSRHMQSSRAPRYRCGNKMHDVPGCGWHSIHARRLDDIVWNQVRRLMTQPALIGSELAKLQTEDPTRADLAAVERRLAEVQKQRTNLALVAAKLDDPEAAEPLAAQLAALAAEKRQLETEREAVQQRQAAWAHRQEGLANLRRLCAAYGQTIDEMTYEERRDLLYALGVRVYVYRKDHEPWYAIEASLPLDMGDGDVPSVLELPTSSG